jgi:hypothetical protein
MDGQSARDSTMATDLLLRLVRNALEHAIRSGVSRECIGAIFEPETRPGGLRAPTNRSTTRSGAPEVSPSEPISVACRGEIAEAGGLPRWNPYATRG